MKPFVHYSPTSLHCGPGKISEIGAHAQKIGTRPLLVTGKNSARKSGLLDKVVSSLKEKDITPVVFEGIEPNPRNTTVNDAAELGRSKNVDFIIALGGGSTMDASKCIASIIPQPGIDSWDLTIGQKYAGQIGAPLSIVAIPTTAATASEVTQYAVLSNISVNGKSVIAHDLLRPKISILDPELTLSVPAYATADHSCDILSHIFENYILGGNDSIIADRYSEALIKTVIEDTPRAIHKENELHARSNLQWAATLALNGIQLAGRDPSEFPLHSMEHACSGTYPDLAHGRGLAVLFPAYFQWLIKNNRAVERFARLARKVFGSTETNDSKAAQVWCHSFNEWLNSIGSFHCLPKAGVKKESFDSIAHYAVSTYGTNGVLNALGALTKENIVTIFEMTMEQG